MSETQRVTGVDATRVPAALKSGVSVEFSPLHNRRPPRPTANTGNGILAASGRERLRGNDARTALLGLRDGPTLDASSKHLPAMTEQVADAPGDQVVEQLVDRPCSGGA
jgi:hypothetical protein